MEGRGWSRSPKEETTTTKMDRMGQKSEKEGKKEKRE
jgi:hypothetical protein